MHSFQHLAPPLRLLGGMECLEQLGRELERLHCSRAMIVCGPSLAREAALLERLRAALGERCAGVFTGVRAHSPLPVVEMAARELERVAADAVVAVGGGSAIVTARAAGILVAEGGDARSLCTTWDASGRLHSPKLLAPKLPQFVVPTTPTTAIMKAGSAVLDPEARVRLALYDPKTRAQAVFVHPACVASAPRALVVSASLNTFAMAVEGLLSRSGDPLADAALMHALRLAAGHLPRLAGDDTPSRRAELVLAAVLCGQGTDHAGAGITTVLGHNVGARHEGDNGITNAIVLPHVLRFNADAAKEGMDKVAAALGVAAADGALRMPAVVDAVEAMFRGLAIPSRLRDVGVPREALPEIATGAMGDWFLRGNPRPVRDPAELLQVLEAAW